MLFKHTLVSHPIPGFPSISFGPYITRCLTVSDAICSKYGCLMLVVPDHDAIRAKGENMVRVLMLEGLLFLYISFNSATAVSTEH